VQAAYPLFSECFHKVVIDSLVAHNFKRLEKLFLCLLTYADPFIDDTDLKLAPGVEVIALD
jgi:hypothetical protein